jgi:hypothetical protein
MITCKTTEYFRQEFHELEILNKIAKMRHKNTLSIKVQNSVRNSLIKYFQKWKGTTYMPLSIHKTLKWSVKDPLPLYISTWYGEDGIQENTRCPDFFNCLNYPLLFV